MVVGINTNVMLGENTGTLITMFEINVNQNVGILKNEERACGVFE